MILSVLLTISASTLTAADCITYTCEDLPDNKCAYKQADLEVVLNDNSCEDGFSCSFDDLIPWASASAVDSSLLCSGEAVMPLYDELIDSYLCGKRLENKDLYIMDYPKKCATIEDCLLEDQTYTECGCALDGNTYCRASIYSKEFDEYWDECDDDGVIDDEDEVVWWTIYNEYYLFTIDAPGCAEDLIWEFSYMSDVIDSFGLRSLSLAGSLATLLLS